MAPPLDDLGPVIAGWQQKLLQLDRRNNLLYFKPGRGSVRLVGRAPDELHEALLAAKRGLTFSHGEKVFVGPQEALERARKDARAKRSGDGTKQESVDGGASARPDGPSEEGATPSATGEGEARESAVGAAAVDEPAADAPEAEESEPVEEPFEEHYEVRILEGQLETEEDVFELEERLRNIQRREREWQEEQGINVLFLAAGFLGWVDEDGEEALAPLVLIPCDLTRRSPRDPFRLVLESDERVLNATLIHKLFTSGIDLPPLDDGKLSDWFQHLREHVLRDRPGWFVEEEVALGIFSYSKLAMWQDLEALRLEGVTHPLVRALAGGSTEPLADEEARERPALPPPHELAGGGLDDLLGLHDRFEVLDADHSQLRAIELARTGSHLVIHGPPGTGKSQTIANIIATQIADGRRVLFVSEKTAALDVVKRRLVQCGLGSFCLDLHSERAKKSSVYRQLAESLDAARPTGSENHDATLARLEETRTRLNETMRALHAVHQPLGLSVFAVCGRFAPLVRLPRIELDVPAVDQLDPARIAALEELAGRVARRGELFREHATSPWRPLLVEASSVELPDRVRGDMQRLRAASEALFAELDGLASDLGLPAPSSPLDAIAWTPVLEQLSGPRAALATGVPRAWLVRDELEAVRERMERSRVRAERWREGCEALARVLRPGDEASPHAGGATGAAGTPGAGDSTSGTDALPYEDLARELRLDEAAAEPLRELFGDDYDARFLPSPEGFHRAWIELREALAERERAFAAWNAWVAEQTGASSKTGPETLRELDAEVARIALTVELGSVPAPWLEPGRIERLAPRVDDAERALAELEAARVALGEEFSDGVTDAVDHEMRVRYRTDWQSFFRRLGGAYRRDDRTLRGYLKRPRKLSVDDALALIERVLEVKGLEEEWRRELRQHEEEFGPRFQGADTDWAALRRDLERTRELVRDGGLDTSELRTLLAGRGVGRELREHAQRVAGAQATLEQALAAIGGLASERETDTLDALFGLLEAGLPEVERIARVAAPIEGRVTDQARGLEEVRAACESASRLEEIEDEVAADAEAERAAFGERARGLATDWRELGDALAWTSKLLNLLGPLATIEPGAEPPRAEALQRRIERALTSDEVTRIEAGVRASLARFDEATALLRAHFDERRTAWGEWRRAPFDELQDWTRALEGRAGSAANWIDYRQACLDLEQSLGEGLVDRVRAVTEDATELPAILMRRLWLAWLEWAFAREPALTITAADLGGLEERFGELDRELPAIARARVRARAFEGYPATHSTSLRAGQLGTLRGELSKRRRQLSVRALVTEIPGLLQTLKPCFLMSPLSVSQYLPRAGGDAHGLEFDVVIFDEASQVFPEDAVPAIARAKQVIVVGDQQQLPPTQFFRGVGAAEVEGAGESEGAPDLVDRFEGRESILDVMVGLAGQGVAAEYLAVHYRSRHSDLIRYSNHHFYGDRLFTFPGAQGGGEHLGVHGVYLEDGLFGAGSSRTNRREAEVVVERVFDLMRSRPFAESIGVVTLSRAQADLIERLIARRRRDERELDERFAPDLAERFFVKNLENVQGDERDHILLSIGYGPSERGGAVANRFGPINQPGGERRLNVAVSRARRSMTVVHSMRPEHVTAQNEGARLLRDFLAFVHDPAVASPDEAGPEVASSREGARLAEEVAAGLEERGWRVDARVGVAGYFVDLALRRDEAGARYALGIELDGPQCHATPTARDRDRLRPSVLGGLGWTLYRLRATAWIRDPEGELERIARLAEESERAAAEADEAVSLSAPAPVGANSIEDAQGDADEEVDDVGEGDEASVGADASAAGTDAPGDAQSLFAPYEVATLERFDAEKELGDEPSDKWQRMLARVVEIEGPVHRDLAFDRIRERYGSPRSTKSLRAAFDQAVQAGIRKEDLFYLPVTDEDEDANTFLRGASDEARPRRPTGEQAARNIKQVAGSELEAALLVVVEALFGAGDDDAIAETARQLGYQRVGASIARRLEAARDRLLADGRLVRQFDFLTLPRPE